MEERFAMSERDKTCKRVCNYWLVVKRLQWLIHQWQSQHLSRYGVPTMEQGFLMNQGDCYSEDDHQVVASETPPVMYGDGAGTSKGKTSQIINQIQYGSQEEKKA